MWGQGASLFNSATQPGQYDTPPQLALGKSVPCMLKAPKGDSSTQSRIQGTSQADNPLIQISMFVRPQAHG